MKWDLEFGPSIDKLQALRDTGRPVPALDRRPELPSTLDWIWSAYAEFNKGRSWNMGAPQPIALTEIIAYVGLLDLSREEAQDLVGFVRLLDEVYFEKAAELAKRKNGRTSGNNRRSRSANRSASGNP